MGNFHKLATLSTAPWAAKPKMNTHLLYSGHWGMGMNPLSRITNFSKNNHIFRSLFPEFTPPSWSLAIFSCMTFPLPSGQGETSSIFWTSRAWWVETTPAVVLDIQQVFVLFCFVGRCKVENLDIQPKHPRTSIWWGFLVWVARKNHLHPETKAGNNPVAHKGVLFSFFNKV